MKLYRVSSGSLFDRYREIVKDNENSSNSLIRRKLTRNIQLAMKVELDKDLTLYMYGNLHIFVRGNRITWIRNKISKHNWFYKDKKRYAELNEILGIKDNAVITAAV
jgi:hypothetical protein